MIYLQEKYIKLCDFPLLSSDGKNFNFRCVICNDSQKKKTKKRGYILEKDNAYFYYCHNCNVSMPFEKFLKEYKYELYLDYIREKYGNTKKVIDKPREIKYNSTDKYKDFVESHSILNDIEKVVDIGRRNDIIDFLEHRKIPLSLIKRLYWTYDFWEFTRKTLKKKYKNKFKEKRIIIPCYNRDKKLVAVQGRNLTGGEYKYITIALNESKLMLWNIENININNNVYVFEGIFDACYFKNAVATLGTSFSERELRKQIKSPIFVFDNDFRANRQVKGRMIKMIKSGFTISIFPNNFPYKDVNEAIVDGMKKKEIKKIIERNKCFGNEALIKIEI